MTIKWGKLKPLDDYKTGLYPHNRWGMIYPLKKHGGWKCMSCLNIFQVLETGARSARKHYCVQEHAWRIYAGRPAPTVTEAPPQTDIKPIEKVIDESALQLVWGIAFLMMRR